MADQEDKNPEFVAIQYGPEGAKTVAGPSANPTEVIADAGKHVGEDGVVLVFGTTNRKPRYRLIPSADTRH